MKNTETKTLDTLVETTRGAVAYRDLQVGDRVVAGDLKIPVKEIKYLD